MEVANGKVVCTRMHTKICIELQNISRKIRILGKYTYSHCYTLFWETCWWEYICSKPITFDLTLAIPQHLSFIRRSVYISHTANSNRYYCVPALD